MPDYTIYFGADHRGFEKKEQLMALTKNCHGFIKAVDCGADHQDPEDDFNDPAIAVASAVLEHKSSFGVLICGSAHGVTMQANRLKGVRAIFASTVDSARMGREDEDANILCLSADNLSTEDMDEILKAFCHTQPKTDEKYLRRIKRLDNDSDWPEASK